MPFVQISTGGNVQSYLQGPFLIEVMVFKKSVICLSNSWISNIVIFLF